jgi:PrgI family protein
MRFQVPQFIGVEDKIFGPLTFRQFVYLVGGAGICFILYNFLPHLLAFVLMIPAAVFSLALTFYKVNNKPFIVVLEAAFKYSVNPRLYLWKKEQNVPSAKKDPSALPETSGGLYVPRLSDSRLKDIAWQLDVHDTVPRG